MRSMKVKLLAAAALTAFAVGVCTMGGPAAQYVSGRIRAASVAQPLETEELQTLSGSAAAVAVLPEARYIVDGAATDSGYTLEIKADGLFAYTGRLALVFDTEKLALAGPDDLSAFQMARGLSPVPEAENMVSSEQGRASLAWYCSGLDSRTEQKTIATLAFTFKEGYSASDLDSASFRLMAVEEGDLGPFRSAASFQGDGQREPIPYEYLTDQQACGVTFTYEGSDRAPADGSLITFTCENNLEEPLEGLLELDGRTYLIDGSATLLLASGEYLYRLQCDGYGAESGRLTVSEDAEIKATLENDESLVRQEQNALELTFLEGDSADHVSGALGLTESTESGVEISWSSTAPGVISEQGLVVLPEEEGTDVTLTATLTKGEAALTKEFTVYVCSKAELIDEPEVPETPETSETPAQTPEAPADTTVETPAEKTEFTDLAQYDWAKDAIYHLAEEGVIKGTSETTFTPGNNIRRGDYILILTRMFQLESDKTAEDFDDVAKDSYYYEAIQTARALGIAQGDDNNRFRPEASITRQDMITLTMRAVEITGYLPVDSAEASLSEFLDSNDVAAYAQESMKVAVGEGFIIGDQNLLNPLGYTTRAQAAVFAERIMNAHNG